MSYSPDPSDLTTLADVKAWLNIPSDNTTDDDLLQRLITAASGFIQAWLNRVLRQQIYTEVRNGTGHRKMAFGNAPVVSVASVTIDGIPFYPSAGPHAPGYVFDEGMLYLRSAFHFFNKGFQNIEIDYTAGYSPIPYEISQACIEMLSVRYKERDRIGLVSKGLAGETISFTQKDMPASTQTVLQQYKRVFTP